MEWKPLESVLGMLWGSSPIIMWTSAMSLFESLSTQLRLTEDFEDTQITPRVMSVTYLLILYLKLAMSI